MQAFSLSQEAKSKNGWGKSSTFICSTYTQFLGYVDHVYIKRFLDLLPVNFGHLEHLLKSEIIEQ